MANKPDDDLDPVGWFSLDNERHVVIPVEHRYVIEVAPMTHYPPEILLHHRDD